MLVFWCMTAREKPGEKEMKGADNRELAGSLADDQYS